MRIKHAASCSGALAGITLAASSAFAQFGGFVLDPVFDTQCVEEIVAGGQHTCALLDTGKVRCWGNNDAGQLNVPSGKFVQIASGGTFSCGIRTTGKVECWGDTSYWNFSTPQVDFVQIDAAGEHICGVDTTSRVRCWGYSYAGRIVFAPTSTGWISASAGAAHSCGVKSTGRFECWGYANNISGGPAVVDFDAGAGQGCRLSYNASLGHDAVYCHPGSQPPFQRELAQHNGSSWGTPYTNMSLYGAHVCALRDTGEIDCWGDNRKNQCDAPPGNSFVQVTAGGAHSCALDAGNRVTCWGDPGDGKLNAPDFGLCLSVQKRPPFQL